MIKMQLQLFGGRGGGSGMSGGGGGASASESGGGFMNNDDNIKDYYMATMAGGMSREDMEDIWSTPEGRQDLRDWFNEEKNLGLTEQEMRDAIQQTGGPQRASVPSLANNSDDMKRQVQNARQNGYKSSQVNEMVREAQAAGWKETYPSYNASSGTVYRSMSTRGTGALSERTAKVTTTERGVGLYVTDGNRGSEYRFSNVTDAIKSGDKFVSNRKASTRSGGPKDNEFIVGSGRCR